jgi:hypothetical protein
MRTRIQYTTHDLLYIEFLVEPPPLEQIDKNGEALLCSYIGGDYIREAQNNPGRMITIESKEVKSKESTDATQPSIQQEP